MLYSFLFRTARLTAALGVAAGSVFLAWGQTNPLLSVPDRLVRSEEGFSLDLEGGFELGKQQDGYYLLGSRTIPGLILVKAMPALTAADLNENLRSGYTDSTVQLIPEGPITELAFQGGSGKLAEVHGSLLNGEVQGLLAGYLRPGGGGLLLFAVTSPEQWPKLNPVAGQVARSVRLFLPDPQDLIRLWTQRLAGFKLVQATDTSETRRGKRSGDAGGKVYSLCGDGMFLYEESGAGAPPQSSAGDAAAGRKAGTWEVAPQRLRSDLVFTFQDGKTHTYRLSRDDQETYLDDQRYFVLPTEQCR